MSVVFLNYTTEVFSPVSGNSLSTYIWEVCQRASRDGMKPFVLTKRHDSQPYPWPNTIFVDYPDLPTNPLLFRFERLKRKVSRWPHLRHWVYAERVASAIRQAGLENMPFVLQNDVELAIYLRRRFPKIFILLLFQNYHPIKRFFPGTVGEGANVIAAVSNHTARWVEHTYRLTSGSVATLYNGVDPIQFSPSEGQSEGVPAINFTGRICPEKGPDLILRAGLRLARRCKDFRLQFLGWCQANAGQATPFMIELERLAVELERLGIQVRRGGLVERERVPVEIRKAHIHVTPSRWEEAFGLTTVEGMASGLAVVGSRTGGTPEIIDDSGFLFDRDDVQGLSDHLERLVADHRLRADYGRRARSRAMNFTWDHTWKGIRTLVGI